VYVLQSKVLQVVLLQELPAHRADGLVGAMRCPRRWKVFEASGARSTVVPARACETLENGSIDDSAEIVGTHQKNPAVERRLEKNRVAEKSLAEARNPVAARNPEKNPAEEKNPARNLVVEKNLEKNRVAEKKLAEASERLKAKSVLASVAHVTIALSRER